MEKGCLRASLFYLKTLDFFPKIEYSRNITILMIIKKKSVIIAVALVLVIAAVGYFSSKGKGKIEYTSADVQRGTLLQSVSETGTITPAKEIELNFMSSGQLAKLNVKVGDQVVPDQVLAQIDLSGLAIKETEAQASLNVAQASAQQASASYDAAKREYDRTVASLSESLRQAEKTKADLEDRGAGTVTTYEQAIATAQASLTSTITTYQRGIDNKYESLRQTLENKIANATTALDAINRIKTDPDLRPTFSIQNSSIISALNTAYEQSRVLLSSASLRVTFLKNNKSYENVAATYDSSQSVLSKTSETLSLTFSALESSISNSNYTQAELDAAKATIDGQTTAISTAINTIQSSKQAYDDARLSYDTNVLSAEQSLNQAQVNYNNAVITARNAVNTARTNKDQQINLAQSRVDNAASAANVARAQIGQASANLDAVRNQIADNSLKSPIKGVITKINYEIGEQVTPSKALVSVLTENNYQIEVDISETDIAKLKLNDTAEITLDALGPDIKFTGKVYFIEPAATIIQGVTYYKVKISFDPTGQPSVKPGMTASAVIMTNKRENVLIMPARAVVEKDGKTIVRILENENVREAEVQIGLNGDDGMVEVLSGVNEGNKVVTFIKDPNKK